MLAQQADMVATTILTWACTASWRDLATDNFFHMYLPSDAAKSSTMYKHVSETCWLSKQTRLLEPFSLEPALLAGVILQLTTSATCICPVALLKEAAFMLWGP